MVQKKFGLNENFDPTRILIRKNFNPKKILVRKNILVKKTFWFEKKNFVQKKFWS